MTLTETPLDGHLKIGRDVAVEGFGFKLCVRRRRKAQGDAAVDGLEFERLCPVGSPEGSDDLPVDRAGAVTPVETRTDPLTCGFTSAPSDVPDSSVDLFPEANAPGRGL